MLWVFEYKVNYFYVIWEIVTVRDDSASVGPSPEQLQGLFQAAGRKVELADLFN